MKGLGKILLMMRPPNSFMTGIGVIFSYMVYAGRPPSLILAVIGFLTGYLVCGGSMLINDYVDRLVDAVNKPWKPLPSGQVSPRMVLWSSLVCFTIPVLLNLLVSPSTVLVAITYGFIGYLYSYMRRHWWSHYLVGISTTGPIIYGYVAAGAPAKWLVFTIMFAATMTLISSSREFVKAMQDIEGDKKYGYVTVAIMFGPRRAGVLSVAHGVAGLVIGLAAGIVAGTSIWYEVLLLLAGIAFTREAMIAYKNPWDKTLLEKTRKKMLAYMMLGLIAFWLSTLPPRIPV